MKGVQKRFLSQFLERPSQEDLFRGTRLDPAKPDRLEAIDHVGRRIITRSRRVGDGLGSRSRAGGASKSPLRVSDAGDGGDCGGASGTLGRGTAVRRLRRGDRRASARAAISAVSSASSASELVSGGGAIVGSRLESRSHCVISLIGFRQRAHPSRSSSASVKRRSRQTRQSDDDAVGCDAASPPPGRPPISHASDDDQMRPSSERADPRDSSGRSTPA